MSVTTPPRARPSGSTPAAPSLSSAGALDERPIRHPNTRSPQVMTRRAWWLVALNFLLPGSAQVLAGNKRLGRIGLGATIAVWLLAIAALGTFLVAPTVIYSLFTLGWVLLLVQVLLLAYAVLWVVLTIDTLRLVRLVRTRPRARAGIAILAIAGTVLASGTAVYGAQQLLGPAREALGSIFANTAPPVPPSNGYYNFLLLGADSGLGRDSMRFDSISVVSVNATSGAVTITGIPRDLQNVPFSDGPMKERYPDGLEGHASRTCGWAAGINQLMNAVETCQPDRGAGIYPDAAANHSTPAVEATRDAAEGVMGIEIPYYVFVDMKGFADIVDALGGVDITVQERLPEGGGPSYEGQSAEDWASGWIEAGPQHMDGDTAQWYARSRYTTSDWDRMRRQRELQQAILAQANPTNVLSHFNEIAAAGEDLVQTDIPASLLSFLVDIALKSKEQPVQTLELTPQGAGINPDKPSADDWVRIRELVDAALYPPTPTPTPDS
ncbi:LCP family protein [Microbacterium sp. W1N]|uniref:LCP family protein n=1 Tax=Microbacterium festucae TaxID=2977531 RepID=UPI0021C24515|nr:LCP family protein [Microbacterium festucae]MCT9818778.1 LCP family protein [Microbacterium festucae]